MDTKKYNDYVEQVTPKHSCFLNTLKAFVSGGLLCLIGQALTNLFISTGMSLTLASSYTTLCLIAASVILTGFNLVVPIVKFAGAGYLVPITGFANSVAACSIEFRQDACVIITLNQESCYSKGKYADLVQLAQKKEGRYPPVYSKFNTLSQKTGKVEVPFRQRML